jgi:hypothetical protein
VCVSQRHVVLRMLSVAKHGCPLVGGPPSGRVGMVVCGSSGAIERWAARPGSTTTPFVSMPLVNLVGVADRGELTLGPTCAACWPSGGGVGPGGEMPVVRVWRPRQPDALGPAGH